MRAVIKKVAENAKIIEIENTLEAMQEILGKDIKEEYFTNGVHLIRNEWGIINDERPNFYAFPDRLFFGDVLFIGINYDEDKRISLTDERLEYLLWYLQHCPGPTGHEKEDHYRILGLNQLHVKQLYTRVK